MPFLKACTAIALSLLLLSAAERKHKSTGDTEHVREYTTKSGKVVAAHERSKPASRAVEPRVKASAPAVEVAPHRPDRCATCARSETGRIERSRAATRSFERERPCPSTGRTSGGCPGYVIDHVKPLACGGVDAPSNMNWQTLADSKAKDRVERAGCR